MALSREDVVDGALTLLDEVGLDELTMRRLAQALDVQAGAIYWHFKNKQALIDAMTETMFAGALDAPLAGAWDVQIAELSRRMAAAMLRRRDGARLAMSALRPGPNGLALSEALFRTLRRRGKPKRATLWAVAVIGYYVLGYVTDLQATEAAKARGLMSVVRSFRKKLDRSQYPEIYGISDQAIKEMMTAQSARARFEFGLQVIIRGLKAEAKAKSGSTRARRP
jgi:TetR/AcrR family transcriptional regulator, tetracycline repressor protein